MYVTGAFSLTVDFDPSGGTSISTSVGNSDIFFAKYTSDGDFIWAKSAGSSSGYDNGQAIGIDDSGNVYITGSFYGPTDFDPSTGTTDLISAGSSDIFFAKYDINGDLVWAESAGSSSYDYGSDLTVDGSGKVYITGSFGDTVDFDPSAGGTNVLTSVGNSDAFFVNHDSEGNIVWAKSIGGSLDDAAKSICLDAAGYVYIAGYFSGTADFDPGTDTDEHTSNGSDDIYFARYYLDEPSK